MIRLALGLAALVLTAGPVAAQSTDTSGCNRASATAATVRDLVRDPAPFIGHCVGISGVWEGGVLYADADAYDLSEGMEGWNATQGVRIGAEAAAPLAARMEARGPLRVVVYGVIDDCGRLQDRSTGGYCLHSDGPRMAIADVRFGRAGRDEQTRLTRLSRR
jgi:hypothetical protein